MMSRANGIIAKVLVVLVFLVIAVSTIKTIKKGDFWSHLATGRFIVENSTIPEADPFNYTSAPLLPDKVVFLKAYWLAQSAMYLSVKMFGFQSAVFIVSMVFTSIFAILFILMRRKGLGRPLSLLLVLSIVLGMKHFNQFRPMIVSFPLTLLLFAVLDKLRYDAEAFRDYRLLIALPLTMALWSNMHGAYIVGAGMICIYVGFEFLMALTNGYFDRRFKIIVATAAVALLACGLNPMGFELMNPKHIYAFLSKGAGEGTASYGTIIEYYSPVRFFRYTGRASYFYSLIAATAVLVMSFAVNWRRMNIFHLAIALMFTFAGWLSFRYGAYLLMFAALLTAYNLSDFKWSRREEVRLYAVPALAALVLLPVVWPSSWMALQSNVLPTGASAFIMENRLPKRLFAPFSWGGFLEWQLYPDYKTFIDGRVLNEEAFREYNILMMGPEESGALLDKHEINTVLLYIVGTADKKIPPLIFYLLKSDEWEAAYMDRLSLVFLRKRTGVQTTLSKDAVWSYLTNFGIAWVNTYPGKAITHSQLGKIFFHKGKMAEARESFMMALAINPRDAESRVYMQAIQRGGGYRLP